MKQWYYLKHQKSQFRKCISQLHQLNKLPRISHASPPTSFSRQSTWLQTEQSGSLHWTQPAVTSPISSTSPMKVSQHTAHVSPDVPGCWAGCGTLFPALKGYCLEEEEPWAPDDRYSRVGTDVEALPHFSAFFLSLSSFSLSFSFSFSSFCFCLSTFLASLSCCFWTFSCSFWSRFCSLSLFFSPFPPAPSSSSALWVQTISTIQYW